MIPSFNAREIKNKTYKIESNLEEAKFFISSKKKA